MRHQGSREQTLNDLVGLTEHVGHYKHCKIIIMLIRLRPKYPKIVLAIEIKWEFSAYVNIPLFTFIQPFPSVGLKGIYK